MYGSHPYSSPPGPQQSGTPQPEWRVAPSTQPPQPSWQPSAVSPPPPSPTPPVSMHSYNQNIYGQMSSPPPPQSVSPLSSFTPSANTASWGVRYNSQQQPPQHTQSPPPLPPRPSSTAAQHFPNVQPHWPAAASSASAYGPPPPANAPPQQWMGSAPYSPQHVGVLPPPPPPLPPGYANTVPQPETQLYQRIPPPPSYSDTVTSSPVSPLNTNLQQIQPLPRPTENLIPQPSLPEQHPTAVSAGGNLRPATAAPPVPPKMSPLIVATGASALGSGGPSDWEHLSPIPGDVDDVATFGSHRETSHSRTYSELPTSQPIGPPEPTPARQSALITPINVSPESHHAQIHDNEALATQPKQSPVSPSTSLEPPHPPPPARVDTAESSYSIAFSTGASASIDNIIEAWKHPVRSEDNHSAEQSTDAKAESPASLHEPSPLDISKQKQEFLQLQSEVPPSQEANNPDSTTNETEKKLPTKSSPLALYDDLDPWSKSSLERYVAMLRKEAVADSDEERFKLFTAFMAKEMKLREILYNIDHDSKADESATAQSTSLQQTPQITTNEPDKVTSPIESGLIPVETEIEFFGSSISEENEDGRYSPGGRPILPRLHTPVSATGLHRSVSLAAGVRDRMGQAQFSRPTSVPPIMNEAMRKQTLSPLTTNPPHAIYTPFRYAEGPQRGSDNLKFDRPAYQAYSALRQASAESGRIMSNAPAPAPTERSSSVTPSIQNENNEIFIGLIREKSVAYRNKPPRRISSPPPPLPAALRQGKPAGPIDELRAMISSPLAKQSESSWHITAKLDLEKYSNDFSYLPKAKKTWEAGNKTRRENLDKERIHRQEESEAHIDELFNEKEIGYADINVLEEDFRQKEARIQLDEERREVEDFAENVFKPSNNRLTEEISTLHGHYESALGQLSHENSRSKDSVKDKYNLSHSMKAVSEICRKLELRYHKRLEIALDLERRRKKAERRPLVFMGDSAALKRVDADFDLMEKQNILRAARDRDERANRLMDSFDEAIIHGLGENQSLLDEVTAKVLNINAATIRSSGIAESELEQMFKSVQCLVDSLRQDSETILHNFNLADAALNDADYQVSVAEARSSGAEADVFQQLNLEKKKEDEKIQTDLKSKIASVRAGPSKIITTMNDLLQALGRAPVLDQPVSSEPSSPAKHPVDALLPGGRPSTANIPSKPVEENIEHHERLRKALDEAKKRNAAKN
ncbi:hypothetical protein FE257_012106 [Aspergillus nanangensis]|uniref:Uncharacterized protein n=1 Tax=Aspergillus nanangensis TaxID=2582783 RepID=A0AAD4CGI9_ASPNN|nr:hypothetical protein FE257_012106 [Aspergillus nanangensis]